MIKVIEANKSFINYVGIGVTLLSWSIVPLFQKKLLETLSPLDLTFSRFFFTAVFLTAFVVVTRLPEVKRLVREEPVLVILSTICGPLAAMLLFNFGITTVNVSIAAFLLALEPVFTYLLAIMVKIERWYVRRFFSVLVAFIGVCLIVFSGETKLDGSYALGILLLVLSPLVWAINTIITKKLVEAYSPISLVSTNFLVSSLILMPFLSSDYLSTMVSLGADEWGALLFCIFPGTVFGFIVWYWCLRFVSPTAISISFYFIPVLTATGGIMFLNEPFSVQMIAGIAVTLYGLYLVNLKNT